MGRLSTTLPRLGAVALALSLAGCITVGPDFQVPDLKQAGVPDQWAASAPQGAATMDTERWWAQFNDGELSALVEAAQHNNPTVDAALARIRQARANAGSSRSALLPKLNGTAGINRNGSSSSDTEGVYVPLNTNRSASLDMSWELDLFGGTRRGVESAKAQLAARQADLHGAQVALAAEVAGNYLQARYAQAMVATAETDLASRGNTDALTQRKLDAGFAAPADVDRTVASVAEARGTLKTWQANYASALNQLVALTGLPHAELTRRLNAGTAQIPRAPAAAWNLVPAQAVAQRPDVAAAERMLEAANANIGVAQAARLPSVKLLGSIGLNQSRYYGSDTKTTLHPWSFGPSISLPLFDGGKGASDVDYARAVYQEAMASYQGKVRNAVLEVENALVRVNAAAQRLDDVELARQGYQRYFDATNVQYREGAASLLALEEARRVLLSSQQARYAEQLEQSQSWISLYKAVGGGWQTAPDDNEQPGILAQLTDALTP